MQIRKCELFNFFYIVQSLQLMSRKKCIRMLVSDQIIPIKIISNDLHCDSVPKRVTHSSLPGAP